MARPGPTSKLERKRAEALAIAKQRRPGADKFIPQRVAGELCFHAYEDGFGWLTYTGVFV